jgi:hypothetical protein
MDLERFNYTKRLAKIGWVGYNNAAIGAWLRPVERTVRVREVGGSNPLAPTDSTQHRHTFA